MPDVRQPMNKFQKYSLTIAIALTVLTPLWFIAAALGTRFELWSIGFGLLRMSFQWGVLLIAAALTFSLGAFVINVATPPRRGAIIAVICMALCGMAMGRIAGIGQDTAALPPIHDIQTDWTDPIAFSDAHVAEREANGWNEIKDNPVVPEAAGGRWPDAVGKSNAELQDSTESYRDKAGKPLAPLILERSMDEAFDLAVATAERQGWAVRLTEPGLGRIEATETSTWYGFTDDIAIRVRSDGAGSRVDVRSISRIGLSDMGANYARVKGYLDDLALAGR
ncbi:MAG: DUF1499 domain-containing protein [Pseudomonadota bacterium]